ncbi:hypothetical protein GGX14DRAFT_666739 [Mycena pura]|uniref:Uncharacterized protein n=1 Tax=Mycena pura TaxID=153505 RepID=A0AAD6Y461_9AGAR|nr:hypothetical protein GGX14DRAFT_666739 [Mycena pura]
MAVAKCKRGGTTTQTASESIMIERRGALLEAPTVDRDRRALGGADAVGSHALDRRAPLALACQAGSALQAVFVLCSIRCACGHLSARGRRRELGWRAWRGVHAWPWGGTQETLSGDGQRTRAARRAQSSPVLTGCAKEARIDREAGGLGARAAGTSTLIERSARGAWVTVTVICCVATSTREIRVCENKRCPRSRCSAQDLWICFRSGDHDGRLRRSRAIWQVTCGGGGSDGVNGVQENSQGTGVIIRWVLERNKEYCVRVWSCAPQRKKKVGFEPSKEQSAWRRRQSTFGKTHGAEVGKSGEGTARVHGKRRRARTSTARTVPALPGGLGEQSSPVYGN